MNTNNPEIGIHTVVSPLANIGIDCKIGSFCFICNDVKIGNNVTIGDYCKINENVSIADNTVIQSYVEIRSNTQIGENCYIDSFVAFSGNSVIGNFVTLRYGAIVARGVHIGNNTYVCPRVMTNNLDTQENVIGVY